MDSLGHNVQFLYVSNEYHCLSYNKMVLTEQVLKIAKTMSILQRKFPLIPNFGHFTPQEEAVLLFLEREQHRLVKIQKNVDKTKRL